MDKLKSIWESFSGFFKMFDLRFWLFTALFLVYFFGNGIKDFPVAIDAIVIVAGLLYVALTIYFGLNKK